MFLQPGRKRQGKAVACRKGAPGGWSLGAAAPPGSKSAATRVPQWGDHPIDAQRRLKGPVMSWRVASRDDTGAPAWKPPTTLFRRVATQNCTSSYVVGPWLGVAPLASSGYSQLLWHGSARCAKAQKPKSRVDRSSNNQGRTPA